MRIDKITIGVYIIIAALFYIFYLMFWPVNVIDIKNQDAIKLDKEVYQAGERATYLFEYCKYGDYPATVSRSLVDGIRINYTAYYNNLPANCGSFHNSDMVIPDFIGSGTYHFEATLEYQVNPIHKVNYHWRSVDFKVENFSNDETQQENRERESMRDYKQINENLVTE